MALRSDSKSALAAEARLGFRPERGRACRCHPAALRGCDRERVVSFHAAPFAPLRVPAPSLGPRGVPSEPRLRPRRLRRCRERPGPAGARPHAAVPHRRESGAATRALPPRSLRIGRCLLWRLIQQRRKDLRTDPCRAARVGVSGIGPLRSYFGHDGRLAAFVSACACACVHARACITLGTRGSMRACINACATRGVLPACVLYVWPASLGRPCHCRIPIQRFGTRRRARRTCVQSRRRCGPVPAQMWASPGADVGKSV